MPGHADFLVDMAYDTGLTSAADYQRFVHDQVTSTLAAVDAGPPVAGFRLFLAVSAYPASRYHDPSVENVGVALAGATAAMTERSEEHTSELQSHLNLVCRLLPGKQQ